MSTTTENAQSRNPAGFITRLITGIDRRLNPFFVKDVRVWLRSKKFMTIFFVALAACQVATVMIIVDGETGQDLFSALVAGLAMVLVGVVPYLMQDKFADELASGSTELAMISRMSPGRMVWGKIQSGLVANLLFFSAVGPSVLIAYMLGGIHPFIMMYILLAVLVFSTLSMTLAIVVVTIIGRRPVKIISLALFGVGLGAAVVVLALSQKSASYQMFNHEGFWYVNAMIAGETLFCGLFLYGVAVSRLSFTSANRDALPRITLSVWTLLHLIIGFSIIFLREHLFHQTDDADDIAEMAIVFGTLAFTSGFFLLTGTAEQLSRRLHKSCRYRINRWILLPGPGRLYFYMMIHFAVLSACAVYYYFNIRHGSDGVLFLAFVLCGYYLISGSYLIYRLFDRFVFTTRKLPPTMIMAVVAGVWLGWGILLAAIFEQRAGPLLVISPASAFYYVGNEKELGAFFVVLITTSPCWLIATWLWLRVFKKEQDGAREMNPPESKADTDADHD